MVEIKQNSIDAIQLLNHFNHCNTALENIDAVVHSKKIFENAETIEAWDGTELCGVCACYMNNYDTHIAYITHIEVHQEFKRQGIGQKIMDATLAEARSKGFKKIQLEVNKKNIVAIAFYEKFGFKSIEDRKIKYLMSLNLS